MSVKKDRAEMHRIHASWVATRPPVQLTEKELKNLEGMGPPPDLSLYTPTQDKRHRCNPFPRKKRGEVHTDEKVQSTAREALSAMRAML